MQDDDFKIISLLTEIRDDTRERVRIARDQAERMIELRKTANAKIEMTVDRQNEGLKLARDNTERAKNAYELI